MKIKSANFDINQGRSFMQVNHSRKILILFALVFVLLGSGILPAQNQIRVQIILSPALRNAQVVYLSNFDFLQLQTAEFLFQVTVDNLSGGGLIGSLRFLVTKDADELVNALTNPFTLPPGMTSFNNIELSNGTELKNGESVKFTETNVTYPNNDFQNEVMQGGKLPPGKYLFSVVFEQDHEVRIPSNVEIIDIINTPFVLPVAPGTDDYTNPEIIYTQFPVFQFNTNITDPLALMQDPFQIEVYQKEEYHATADEVLSTTPYLEEKTGFTLFQYPQGKGVQPLEPGTYVWRVKLLLQTTKGTDEISSPLYVFKYVDPSGASEDVQKQIMTADILRMLRYLIGDQVDDIAKALNNYTISAMRINGEQIDVTALTNKINSYQGTVTKVNELELLSSQK
jgi:hypothetical protein